MNPLIVWAAMLFWGTAQLAPSGLITGTIRLPNGQPAAGVRVVAMAKPNSPQRAAGSAVFESITQTDSNGRYRLENISPGQYLIAAGPVSYPTFHPGTLTQSAASTVTITQSSPSVSGMDFTFTITATPSVEQGALPAALQQGMGIVCCRLKSRLVMADRSLAEFPIQMKVFDRLSGAVANVQSNWRELGYFPLTIPMSSTAEIAIDGLPPGYVLQSVAYGGKDFGLTPFLIDGKSLGTLDLILGPDPAPTLKKVAARGRVINVAPEIRVTSIRFASTLPNGPALVARLQPDGSFEFPEIPVGVYRPGVLDPKGGESTSPNILVIRDDVSSLVIDLHRNPFPEFEGVPPKPTTFTDGKSAKITGVITQKITKFGTADSIYFRMNVKDDATGVVTPWAVFAERDWVPKIVVGETIAVPGVLSTDGTNRISASPF